MPGTRLLVLRAGSKPPTRRTLRLPFLPGRSPRGPETKRRMDELVLSARLLQASDPRRWKQAPTALRLRPARRDQAQGPALPECEPCGTEPLPSAQSDQPRASGCRGEPLQPSTQAVRTRPPQGRPPSEALCRDRICQPRAGAAEVNLHCRWRDPPGLAATRTTALEGALPMARCNRPCCRPLEQAPVTSRANRPSVATTRAALLESTLPGQVRQPNALTAEANLSCRWHRLSKLSDPKITWLGSTLPVAECVNQHLDDRGEPLLSLVPAVRAARPQGPLCSEAPCRWPSAPGERRCRESKLSQLRHQPASGAATRTAVLESTLPVA